MLGKKQVYEWLKNLLEIKEPEGLIKELLARTDYRQYFLFLLEASDKSEFHRLAVKLKEKINNL